MFTNLLGIMISAAAIPAMAASTGCTGSEADLRAPAGSIPPPAIAAQRLAASTWTVVASADFNLDGLGDVLWYDTTSHMIMIWLMNGTRPLAIGPALPAPSGDGWEANNSADFNYDGMGDVLWYNSDQNLFAVWLIKGTGILAAGPPIAAPAGDRWEPGTPGDFNGDGMADIFWYNADKNAVTVWLMNGTRILTPGPIVP